PPQAGPQEGNPPDAPEAPRRPPRTDKPMRVREAGKRDQDHEEVPGLEDAQGAHAASDGGGDPPIPRQEVLKLVILLCLRSLSHNNVRGLSRVAPPVVDALEQATALVLQRLEAVDANSANEGRERRACLCECTERVEDGLVGHRRLR